MFLKTMLKDLSDSARFRQLINADSLPVHLVAVLTGLAAGWQWSGMRMILASAIDPLPGTSTMVGSIALLTAALGPHLPARVVRTVGGFIRRRGSDATGTFWMLRAVRDRDESLLWLALSVIGSAAGVVSILTLVISVGFVQLYQYLLVNFFWNNLTLTGLEWLGVTLTIGPCWVVNGLVLATLSPLVSTRTTSHLHWPGVTSGVLIGLGLAWISHQSLAAKGLSGNQMFMLGVLPMFVLAAIAVGVSHHLERLRSPTSEKEPTAPELTAGAEGLIWLSLVGWGIASALVGSGWLVCQSRAALSQTGGNSHLGWYILILGIGVAAIWSRTRKKMQSASGCGMALWVAGLGSAASATILSYWPGSPSSTLLQVIIMAVPLGYALHYAERAWLARVGSETLGFTQLTTAIMVGLAIGLIAGRWWALSILGPMGLMAAGSLLMLTLGGLMQIYAEKCPARTQHQRLALIFASLAAVIVLFPSDAKRWAKWESHYVASRMPAVDLQQLISDNPPNPRSICLIGVDSIAGEHRLTTSKTRIDIVPLSSPLSESRTALSASQNIHAVEMNAFRLFRLRPSRYDLIYQQSTTNLAVGRFAEYSIEWLSQLEQHTTNGGQVIVDVPLIGMTPEAIVVIAATFQHAMNTPASWAVAQSAGQPVLRLKAYPGTAHRYYDNKQENWFPVNRLLSNQTALRAHSLRCDRIGRTLNNNRANLPIPTLFDWLHHCRANELAANQN